MIEGCLLIAILSTLGLLTIIGHFAAEKIGELAESARSIDKSLAMISMQQQEFINSIGPCDDPECPECYHHPEDDTGDCDEFEHDPNGPDFDQWRR